MIKIIGLLAVVFATSWWGFAKSIKISKRMKNLLDFETAFNLLGNEISFSKNSIDVAFLNISELSRVGKVFEYSISNTKNMGIRNAWKYSINHFSKELCLKNDDVNVINMLSNELGMSDVQSQIKNLEYIETLIHKQYKDAENEYNTSAKMYRSLGILSGLFIAILFI